MADEAVVKIVLKDEGGGAGQSSHSPSPMELEREKIRETMRVRALADALTKGIATPWAPPGQPIPAPVMKGISADKAEFIRLEAEAARRGLSVKEYSKAEVAAAKASKSVEPPAPLTPPPPGPPPEEERQKRKAAVEAIDNALQAMSSATDNMAKGLKSMPEPPAAPPGAPPPPPPAPATTVMMPPPEPPAAGGGAAAGNGTDMPVIDRRLPPRPPTAPADNTTAKGADSAAKLDKSIQEVVELIVKKSDTALELEKKAVRERDDRERKLLELEAWAALHVSRDKQQAIKDARKAEIELEDKQRKNLELEARATLDAVRKRQQAEMAGRFDPVEEAHAKYEASQRQAAINEAYEEIYGKKRSFAEKFTDVVRDPKGSLIDALPGGVGGIVTAVLAADQAAKGAVRSGIGAARSLGEGIASANDDPSESIGRLGDAASAAGEKIPVLGIAAVAAGESLKALSSIMRSLDQTADRYGQYSPQIAQAQAVAEIRQTMGDFRRAQEVGAEMVKYIQARSDIQQKFEDIKVRVLTKLLPIVTRALEILESIMSGGEDISTAITGLMAPLSAIPGASDRMIQAMIDQSRRPPSDPTEMLSDPRFMRHEGEVRGGVRGLVPEQ